MVREDSSSDGVGVRDALTTGRCDLVVGSTDSRDDIRVADAVSRREPRQEIHAGKLGNFEQGFRVERPRRGAASRGRRFLPQLSTGRESMLAGRGHSYVIYHSHIWHRKYQEGVPSRRVQPVKTK